MTRTLIFAATLAILGCSDAVDTVTHEEPSALELGKADAVDHDNWTYYLMTRQDTRRCVSPLCGGVFIKRLNQPETKCADGTWARECYVGGFDFNDIGYTEEEAVEARSAIYSGAVFRGAIVTGYYPDDFTQVPAFVATEVWAPALEKTPKNIFYRAHDVGIMCITSPCPSIDGVRLNRNLGPLVRYAGLDFSKSGASDELVEKAWEALRNDELVIAAKPFTIEGPGGTAEGLRVNQLYFAKLPAHTGACGGRAGACPDGLYCQFNDAWCGMADGQGTCETQPEICAEVYSPVCGCDGVTYQSDCHRKLAGAGFGTPGECAPAPKTCIVAGCSGELCVEEGAGGGFSVCLWRDEFACYDDAACEEQADGSCGWTASKELTSCLDGFAE